jgi:choline kinase
MRAAVILAAGRGSRLRQIVGSRPKCLARVGDCTLLERQIRTLRASGIQRTIVVAGYGAPDVHSTRCSSTRPLPAV